MVNTNIQGVVPLNGRGFTVKSSLGTQPGEYPVLSNMRIENGILESRHSIRHYWGGGVTTAPIANAYPFVGYIEDYVIVASKTQQFCNKLGSDKTAMWAPTSLPTDGNAASFHKIVGSFAYNASWYWLTLRFDFTTNTSSIWAYGTTSAGKTVPGVTFAMLTATKLFEVVSNTFNFNNFFIFKERLWVSCTEGLYFSKALDPINFTVGPSLGGFFKIRDKKLSFSFPHKDSIFILTSASISVLSYSVDPNSDSYLRDVSNVMGAEHGTSHGDQAFVVNAIGLFAITPNNIELVRDDFEVIPNYNNSKLVSWDKYLFVLKTRAQLYTGTSYIFDVGRARVENFWSLADITDSNLWVIDMVTGSCTTWDFNDQFTGTGIQLNERGHITDLVVNPTSAVGSSVLSMMTSKTAGNPGASSTSHLYYTTSELDSSFVFDEAVNNPADNVVRRMKPNIKIQISGFAPDGNEYLVKKFRSMEIMGSFARTDFEVILAYDNQAFVDARARDLVIDTAAIKAAGAKRTPYPARIGLNQRGRAVSFFLRTKNPLTSLDAVVPNLYERVQFADIRFLWTYTSRGPVNLTQSATT